jgi:hypothetical protein
VIFQENDDDSSIILFNKESEDGGIDQINKEIDI